MVKRREGLTGIFEEEVRMNPCTEEEAFMYAGQGVNLILLIFRHK